MVDVNTQNKTISVNVSSSGVSSNVNASGDTTMYYSNKAKEWAISNRIVDGVDYSSKYYAGRANQSALNAQSFAQSAQDSYNNFQNSVDGALSNIDSSVQGAVDEINNTKTTILNDIEFVADGEKKEIEDLIDSGKEELKESIGDIKILTTLEIGDIGIAPLGVDETKGKRRYLNGQVIIQEQYVQFTNKVKSAVALYSSLACTESEWQTIATMTVGGQVGKFVVDDEAGTIRLPKIIMPIQGLTDLSKLAEIVEAGLPTHTHTRGTMNITGTFTMDGNSVGTGAFYSSPASTSTNIGAGGNENGRMAFNASNSWTGSTSTGNYSKSLATTNTVQQEQIQYPYFIQVATGAETEDNIINEIELNNPFSLLDYKYSEYELNNLSWLRSNGQYNSKITYPAVYDLLLKIYNGAETKAGVSVKLSTEDFSDTDFVLNTTDETFRLPIKVKQKFFNSGNVPVVGNGMTLGLRQGSNSLGMTTGNDKTIYPSAAAYGTNTGTSMSNWSTVSVANMTMGVTTDASKSGLIAKLSSTEVSGLYLYFYVGETVQNANLINAGRIEEKIASLGGKVASLGGKVASLIPDNKSLISGYALPSDNWISLTLGSAGSNYTAPANGYVLIRKFSNAIGQHLTAFNNSGIGDTKISTIASQALWVWFPVKKGETFHVNYTAGGATELFRFIYAEGEK